MKDLVDTTEMYLRTIYDLEEEGVRPLRARIAERLEQSGPTVSQTVARMERDGLLLVAFVIIAPRGLVGLWQDYMRNRRPRADAVAPPAAGASQSGAH